MPDLAQPAWPLRFTELPDGTVQLAELEQGTADDRKARAAIVICTPREHRDDEPGFGITTLPFQQAHVDTVRLAAEITQSDPALDVTADEVIDLAAATARHVRVDVGSDA